MADKGPNLTWIFIGMAIAIVVLTLSFSTMSTFLSDNNVSISDQFGATGDNLTDIQEAFALITDVELLSNKKIRKDVTAYLNI